MKKKMKFKVIFSNGETDYPEVIEASNEVHLYDILEGFEQDIVDIKELDEKPRTN